MQCTSRVQFPGGETCGEFENIGLFSSQFNWYQSIKYQDSHYPCGKAGWFSARTLAFHQCNLPVIWFAGSIPALVGFLRHSGFLLHAKTRISSHLLGTAPWTLFLKNLCIFKKIKQLCTKYPMDLIMLQGTKKSQFYFIRDHGCEVTVNNV